MTRLFGLSSLHSISSSVSSSSNDKDCLTKSNFGFEFELPPPPLASLLATLADKFGSLIENLADLIIKVFCNIFFVVELLFVVVINELFDV